MSSDLRLNEILAAYLEADASGRAKLLAEHLRYAEQLIQFLDDEAWLHGAMEAGQSPSTVAPQSVPVGSPLRVRYVGDYELLGEIARGGMGVVYRARQQSLSREVALKMMLAGEHASDDLLRRFRAEAEMAANLDHPNVVPVYEVGVHEGHPYFSMKLIEGSDLTKEMARMRGRPRDVAALLAKVARAVHHAHQRGVLHRDLKPSNILLDGNGEPHVADFGLARQGDGVASQSGAVIGTPAYMSPEQARAEKGLTVATDTWSLGAILYEALVGRPPFGGGNALEVLRAVTADEPAEVQGDLGVIALKCLEKEPAKRYGSAAELADDLERWLRGEPILARPVGVMGRLGRWARREPVTASLASAVALVLVAGTAVAWLLAGWALREKGRADYEAGEKGKEALAARRAEQDAKDEQAIAEAAKTRAEELAKREKSERQRADESKKAANQAQQHAEGEKAKADEQRRRADTLHYTSQLNMIRRELELGNHLRAEELLDRCQPEQRGWEHQYLVALCNRRLRTLKGHKGAVRCVAFSPDGKTLASASSLPAMKIGTQFVHNAGEVRLWDVATGKERAFLKNITRRVEILAFSRNGKILAAAGGSFALGFREFGGTSSSPADVQLWEVDTGRELATIRHPKATVAALAFSPDGKTLAGAGATGGVTKKSAEVVLWDVATGKIQTTLKAHPSAVDALAFSPDGKLLAGAGDGVGGRVQTWDVDAGKERAWPRGVLKSSGAVAFGADGKTLIVPWGPEVKTWDVNTGLERAAFVAKRHAVAATAFTPDGKTLLSGGGGTVKAWDVSNGRERGSLTRYNGTINAVAASPDGKILAFNGHDNTVKLWGASGDQEHAVHKVYTGGARTSQTFVPSTVRLSPNGKALASFHEGDGTSLEVKLWNLDTGQETVSHFCNGVSSVKLSPDGATVAFGVRRAGTLEMKLCDVATGQERMTLTGIIGRTSQVEFSPDGKMLAAVGLDYDVNTKKSVAEEVGVWEAATGRRVASIKGGKGPLEFSPDGKLLVLGGDESGSVKAWDLSAGRGRAVLGGHKSGVSSARYSANGKTLVTVCRDAAMVWDAGTLQKRASIPLNGGMNSSAHAAISPDGKTLVSARTFARVIGGTGAKRAGGVKEYVSVVKLWDVDGGVERAPLTGHTGTVDSFAFSPDGRRLATAGSDKTVRVWDVATGLEVHTLTGHDMGVKSVSFSLDGKRLVSAGVNGTVCVWDPSLDYAEPPSMEAVIAQLKERNPGFDGKVTYKSWDEEGVVRELEFHTDHVTDVSPVRALTGLRRLTCTGSDAGKGKLADLSALADMKLSVLNCWNTKVSDLSPLKDMKLLELHCGNSQVSDLSPLKDMRLKALNVFGTKVTDLSPLKDMDLTWLSCPRTQVSDLSPLKGMNLKQLWCWGTRVSDLKPLEGMKLTHLEAHGTKVTDLSPLRGMPLEGLICDFDPKRDSMVLRRLETLKTINGKPAEGFWKEVDAKP